MFSLLQISIAKLSNNWYNTKRCVRYIYKSYIKSQQNPCVESKDTNGKDLKENFTMKKTIMAIVLASALALCATACGNNDTAENATLGESEAVAETATLGDSEAAAE